LQKNGKAALVSKTFNNEPLKETAFEIALSSSPSTFSFHHGALSVLLLAHQLILKSPVQGLRVLSTMPLVQISLNDLSAINKLKICKKRGFRKMKTCPWRYLQSNSTQPQFLKRLNSFLSWCNKQPHMNNWQK